MAPFKHRKDAAKKHLRVFSREFIIENHVDITCCLAMFIMFGLMVQYCQDTEEDRNDLSTYGTGLKDLFTVFYYSLICFLAYEFIQEYILDRMIHKLNLSKSKSSKFTELAMSIVFNMIFIIWTLDIILKENWWADLSSLWTGYPHKALSFSIKLFYIIQFSYWAHNIPKLYVQKIKKAEMVKRVKYYIKNLAFLLTLYIICFHRVGIVVLLFHYYSEFVKYSFKSIEIIEKEDSNKVQLAQYVYGCSFFVSQLLILILSQTVFWIGLNDTKYSVDFPDLLKLFCSFYSLATQGWIVYEFCNDQKAVGINTTVSKKFKPKAGRNDTVKKSRSKLKFH